MAFNGSGTFQRLYNWANDELNEILVRADRMDGEMDSFASGLSNCITRDGQGKPTSSINWNGQDLSGVATLTAQSIVGNTPTMPLGTNDLRLVNAIALNAAIAASGSGTTPGGFNAPYFNAREQQASGTVPDISLSNSATFLQKRVLNTVTSNTISGASLSSSQITLPAGTYQVLARAPAYLGGQTTKTLLYNNTDSSIILVGSATFVSNIGNSDSWLMGQFTIAATKIISLNHYTPGTSDSTTPLGLPASRAGLIEVYAEIQLWRLA